MRTSLFHSPLPPLFMGLLGGLWGYLTLPVTSLSPAPSTVMREASTPFSPPVAPSTPTNSLAPQQASVASSCRVMMPTQQTAFHDTELYQTWFSHHHTQRVLQAWDCSSFYIIRHEHPTGQFTFVESLDKQKESSSFFWKFKLPKTPQLLELNAMNSRTLWFSWATSSPSKTFWTLTLPDNSPSATVAKPLSPQPLTSIITKTSEGMAVESTELTDPSLLSQLQRFSF